MPESFNLIPFSYKSVGGPIQGNLENEQRNQFSLKTPLCAMVRTEFAVVASTEIHQSRQPKCSKEEGLPDDKLSAGPVLAQDAVILRSVPESFFA